MLQQRKLDRISKIYKRGKRGVNCPPSKPLSGSVIVATQVHRSPKPSVLSVAEDTTPTKLEPCKVVFLGIELPMNLSQVSQTEQGVSLAIHIGTCAWVFALEVPS